MNTDVVEMLCEKFGTTVNELIPKIVEWGIGDCTLMLHVTTGFLVLGIILLFLAYICDRSGKYDLDGIAIAFWIFGGATTVICIILIAVALCTRYEWIHYPEVMVYKMIFNHIS